MGVCAAYRIPHSRFLEWSDSDRDKAIWAHIRQLQTCSGCGTRPDEWDPLRGGRMDAYKAVTVRCRGCERVHDLNKSVEDPFVHVVLRANPRS